MRTFEKPEAWLAPCLSEMELDAMLNRIDDCPVESSRTERKSLPESLFTPSGVLLEQTQCFESPTLLRPTPGLAGLEFFPAQIVPSSLGVSNTRRTSREYEAETPSSQQIRESTSSSIQHRTALQSNGDVLRAPAAASTYSPAPIDSNSTGLVADPGVAAEQSFPVETTNAPLSGQCKDMGVSVETDDLPVRQSTRPLDSPPSIHLDLLRMPASEKRLIHHWVIFTSGKLVLVDEPHNPCRSMMLPMALRGLLSDLTESTADVAVFHAICACAAYNLFELGGRRSDQDRALAWRHDEQAIHHLRHNLAQADQHRNESLAMAIMACITIEAISGNTGRWRTHLDGGLAYLAELRKTVIGLEISRAFQGHLVPMAIFCGYQVPTELKSFLQDEADQLEISFPYYGISQSFLRNLDYIDTIATSSTIPSREELDSFELQLYLDFPSSSSIIQSKTHATILHYMTQAFYYALLVYYQRFIRRIAIDDVQALVEKGVAQLEAIETVTQGSAGSVMMWAPLVLAAECSNPDLQRRMRSWFQMKRRLGFRNIIVLDDMVNNLWNKRSSGDKETSWQDLIVKDSFDVFRL
ncbi:hypothetical protein SCUP515_04493 [Seiridium cupressi]